MSEDATGDPLLTTAQVGLLLNKSHRTVHRMAEDGRLAYEVKLPTRNGAYLFRESVVRAAAATAETADGAAA
jgi:hypothetical protein